MIPFGYYKQNTRPSETLHRRYEADAPTLEVGEEADTR